MPASIASLKAQDLMNARGIGAIVLEGGTSVSYFVDVRWGLSERPLLLVIPAKGEVACVAPGFEEQRAREVIKSPVEIARPAVRDDHRPAVCMTRRS